jgi:predicted dehydrogenase
MEKLRLVQCGVGGWGDSWVKHIVPASVDFELVGVVDVNESVLQSAADAAGLSANRRFSSLEAALDRLGRDVDAVLTVTPPAVHLEHARLAFDRGLHLMTEKPIAGNIAEAKEMVRLAEAAGRQLVVSQNYRYRPAAMTIRSLVAEQKFGALGHGHVDFYIPADFTGTFREHMPHVLLADMAIHHIDLVRHIAGRDVDEVFATTFRPAWSWFGHDCALKLQLRLEGGVEFSYSGDWSARGRNTDWHADWRLQCEQGSIHWSFSDVSVARSTRGFVNDTKSEPVSVVPLKLDDRHATLADFARAIRTGTPAPTSGRDNLQSFGTVMAAAVSTRERRAVRLEELLSDV